MTPTNRVEVVLSGNGCCKQGWPKECCGGVTNTWSVAQDDNGELEMSEELKEEIKRIKKLLI